MGSKIFLLLSLLVAIFLLISSDVMARDLAETSIDHKKNAKKATERNGVDGTKHVSSYVNDYGSYGGIGGSCRNGCCGAPVTYGGGCRCCSYAGEAVDAEPEGEPHN